ncbi:MAG TPA: hypothetical protein DIV86_05340 [Alphaproteobacteria bacterium]|nr:hypothetical protein [Alphaproteobacteria bacterium]
MFRKGAGISKIEITSVISFGNIVTNILEELKYRLGECINRKTPTPVNLEDKPKEAAIFFRDQANIAKGPIDNLTKIAEEQGFIVVNTNFGNESIDGFTMSDKNISYIFINSLKSSDRQRFTLAHEIGHNIMHEKPNSNMEKEANDFASELLLPSEELKSEIGVDLNLYRLAELKQKWKVSMAAILMAAGSRGYIEKNKSDYLWKELSARGFRRKEPSSLDFSVEKPSVVASLIEKFNKNFQKNILEDSFEVFGIEKNEFNRMLGMN